MLKIKHWNWQQSTNIPPNTFIAALATAPWKVTTMQGMIEVSDPTDDVELSYAIEILVIEAQENNMDQEEIHDVLRRYTRAVKRGDDSIIK